MRKEILFSYCKFSYNYVTFFKISSFEIPVIEIV